MSRAAIEVAAVLIFAALGIAAECAWLAALATGAGAFWRTHF